MTEETTAPTEETTASTEETKLTKVKKGSYLRPPYVVALYKSGITDMEQLIELVSRHEAGMRLRKNVKHPRNHYFYKRNIHWALTDAAKAGEIDYKIKTRKPRAKLPSVLTEELAKVETSTDDLLPTI